MTPHDSPLGKAVAYADQYDPALLFPIERAAARLELGLDPAALPFTGCDVWNAYELGWLDAHGKPRVALAELRVPASSPRLVESKSLKLYLNAFAHTRLADGDALRGLLARDLAAATGAPVSVVLAAAGAASTPGEPLQGECIDDIAVAIDRYGPPDAGLLAADAQTPASETLVSHLFKSNCPVTGQPDWASVQIRYQGPRLDRAALLRYLVSYRSHCGFHEQCIERMFVDLQRRCAPTRLSVYGRFTRRGGVDINPFRSNVPGAAPGNPRTVRQ